MWFCNLVFVLLLLVVPIVSGGTVCKDIGGFGVMGDITMVLVCLFIAWEPQYMCGSLTIMLKCLI